MREKYDKLCRFLSINKIAVFMGRDSFNEKEKGNMDFIIICY